MNVLRVAAVLGLVILLVLAGAGYNYRVSHHLAAQDNSPAIINVAPDPVTAGPDCQPKPYCDAMVGYSVP